MPSFYLCIIFSFLCLIHPALPVSLSNAANRLAYQIQSNASRRVRPVKRFNDVFRVNVTFDLYQLNSLDAVRQVIDVSSWLSIDWRLADVAWEPGLYENITRVDLREGDLWQPDLVFFNQLAGVIIGRGLLSPVSVDWEGRVRILQDHRGIFYCSSSPRFFPFDQHTCLLALSSSTYYIDTLDLHSSGAGLGEFQGNLIWEVKSLDVEKVFESYDGVEYPILMYRLIFNRKSQFFIGNVIVPSIFISYLSLLNFLIPCDSGEKIGFGVTVFLAQTVNLMIISEHMPRGGSDMPILGQYLLFSIIFIAAVLLQTVWIISLYYHPSPTSAFPPARRAYILKKFSPFIGPCIIVEKVAKNDLKETLDVLTLSSSLTGSSVVNGTRRYSTSFQAHPQSNGHMPLHTIKECESPVVKENFEDEKSMKAACECLSRLIGILWFIVYTIFTFAYMLMLIQVTWELDF